MLPTPRLSITSSLLLAALALAGCGSDSPDPTAPDGRPPDPIDAAVPDSDGAVDGAPPSPDGGPDAAVPPDAPGPDAAEPDAAPPVVEPINLATVDGPAVAGDGPIERKIVPVTIVAAHPDIHVDTSYAVTFGTGNYVYYFFDLVNVASSDRCMVGLDHITYRDSQGAQLGEAASGFVFGTLRKLNGNTTSTCLAPGQHAWVIDLNTDTGIDVIDHADVSVIADDTATTLPAARLFPTEYTYSPGVLSIHLANPGTCAAHVSFAPDWIALDADYLPIEWGVTWTPVDVPGGTDTWFAAFFMLWGPVAHVTVSTDFSDDCTPPSDERPPALAVVDASRERLRARKAAALALEAAQRSRP